MNAGSSEINHLREIKFVVNCHKSHQIIKWLSLSCRPDPEFPEGTVSSIYYDTRNWKYLAEKINSDYLKSKVRVRWYSDINNIKHSKDSFAEAKFKIGSRREKIRVKTPYTGQWLADKSLDNVKLLEIPAILGVKEIVICQNVYPVFQISYKRLRFIEPVTGTRICFDYDIWAPRINSYMMQVFNPFKLHLSVFELKGKMSKLPFMLQPLTNIGCRKASFSKYSACYKKLWE